MRHMNVIDETSSDNYSNASHCRVMKLFVLSSGYVACFNSEADLDYWGGDVIPLSFGSEVSAQKAIDIMQSANPHNLVSFAGGYNEYRNYISR